MSRLSRSFKFAINGLKETFISELNFRIHLMATILVIIGGWYFKVSRLEWIALIICIVMVLAAELFNTAVELLIDLVSPEFNPKAGLVKDIAAAAVLLIALMSLAVGLIIFVPKIF